MLPTVMPMCRVVKPAIAVALYFGLLFGSYGLRCFGQTAPESGQAVAEQVEPPAPTAIPVADLAGAADEVASFQREIELSSRLDSEVVRIETQLEEISEYVRTLEAYTAGQIESQSSTDDYSDLEANWQRTNKRLAAWQESLAAQLAVLAEFESGLDNRRESWRLTLRSSREPEFPAPLREMVQATLESIGKSRQALQERRRKLISLRNDVIELRVVCQDRLQEVTQEIEKLRSRLFFFDEPPITALGLTREAPGFFNYYYQVFSRDLKSLADYFAVEKERTILNLLILLGLLVSFFYLRRRLAGSRLRETQLRGAARVLRRPLASALVIGMLVSSVLNPQSPVALLKLTTLILIGALLRLLPGTFPRELVPVLSILLGLRVLQLGGSGLLGGSLPGRLFQVLVAVTALTGLIWLARLLRQKVILKPLWQKTIRIGVGVAVCLVLGATVAYLFGGVVLGRLLMSAVLRSIFLAVMAWVVHDVLMGILQVLLNSGPARRSRVLADHQAAIIRGTGRLLGIGFGLIWLSFFLKTLFLYDALSGWLGGFLTTPLEVGELSVSLRDVLVFGSAVWLSFFLARSVTLLLDEDVLPRFALPRGVPGTVSRLSYYAALFIGFLLAVGAAGVQLDRFAIFAGAFGVGIGFGLQNVVNNFVSGLILLFERPIQLGDRVQVGEFIGEVSYIGTRASTIRTFDGAEVIVPNGDLISEKVVNWTLTDVRRRIEITVGVAYGTDPARVIEVLKETAARHPEVMTDPAPMAVMTFFGESSLDFSLRAWVPEFDRAVAVKSELTMGILKALTDAGIEIPFPQRDLHIRTVVASLDGAVLKDSGSQSRKSEIGDG